MGGALGGIGGGARMGAHTCSLTLVESLLSADLTTSSNPVWHFGAQNAPMFPFALIFTCKLFPFGQLLEIFLMRHKRISSVTRVPHIASRSATSTDIEGGGEAKGAANRNGRVGLDRRGRRGRGQWTNLDTEKRIGRLVWLLISFLWSRK